MPNITGRINLAEVIVDSDGTFEFISHLGVLFKNFASCDSQLSTGHGSSRMFGCLGGCPAQNKWGPFGDFP